jgi:predicted ribonuclease toxin of YeeF-YezG toxin-antitoxin module
VKSILKVIFNFIKTIINKIIYNNKINTLLDVQKELETDIMDSKDKVEDLKDKLEEDVEMKDAKEAEDFIKNFINKGRK